MKNLKTSGPLLLFTLLFLSIQSYSQCTGANMSNPIVVGTLSAGSNYSNTQDNSNSCFVNDIGQSSYDIYYRFIIGSSLQVNISHCSSGFDTYMHLLNSSGTVIATSDDNGPLCSGSTASMTQTLAAGTYYVVSEGYGSSSGNITTSISIPGAGSSSGAGWQLSGANINNTNSGNVGIGTSNPASKLHVVGGSVATSLDDGLSGFVQLWNDNAIIWKNGNNNGGLRFGSSTNLLAANWSEKMRITDAGNIGIGTANPIEKLEVNGNVKFNSGSNPLYFTSGWSATPDGSANNVSEVANDVVDYKRLMIVGNRSAGSDRRVGIWDRLDIGGIGFHQVLNVNGGAYINGNLGVGNTNPTTKLHVSGNALIETDSDDVLTFNNADNSSQYMQFKGGGTRKAWVGMDASNNFTISKETGGAILLNGANVGIGTSNVSDPNYKLFVETGIKTRKVKVDQASWPDYVFAANYHLPNLKTVEEHIQKFKHLPGVPSAQEVAQKGLDLGDNQATLLQKVEELTLYIIEQHKQIETLKKEMQDLKTAIHQ